MLKFFVSLVLFSSNIVFGQSSGISSDHIFDVQSIYINSFGYMHYSNDEQHSNFTVDWRVNENNSLMINGNYDTNSVGDISRFQFIYKTKLTANFNAFAGYEKSIQREIFGGNIAKNSKAIIGLGYNVDDSVSLQVINQTNVGNQSFSNLDIGSLIKLGTKVKF
ncbi:hypothetical protein KO500_00585 [Cellulophaga baltica]|uniref:hypothetical protein n=1 Tax=Cellulophaga TaxID=104264 RepID=UPI001C076A08|nr:MULTISPECIES: hypothetical protein [Cellulophaga]MBU2994908.1 hypothetical protein [Cellulophaga baltica]MDO6766302.1 hypothetical protein [Cellulophaga sp. 1_MG-2023]